MANADKVMIGNDGHWIEVKAFAPISKTPGVHIVLGEDGETDASKIMTEWETFEVIKKLAEASGLLLDRTGAMGLIINRPSNPKEEERREQLADQFSYGEWEYKDLPDSTKNAINHILTEEIKRGEL